MPPLIERAQFIQRLPPSVAIDARRIGKPQDWIAAIAKLHTLVLRRQKPAPPQAIVKRLIVRPALPLAGQHDVGRKITILTAQAIRKPRSNARPPRELRPGLRKRNCGIVVDRLG